MSLRTIGSFIVGPLMLATLTAVVTLLLLLALSAVLGGEARARAEQSRCYSGLTNAMLHDLLDAQGLNDPYPRVNVAEVDCSFLTEPVSP